MYKNIRIQNFRGIKDLEINDLGRVNLIVDANNVGKSSVLEALALLNSENDPALLLEMAEARGFAVDQLSPDLLFSMIRGQSSVRRPRIEGTDSGVTESLTFMFSDAIGRSEGEKIRQYNIITVSDSRSELSGKLELNFSVSGGYQGEDSIQVESKLAMQSNWREINERRISSYEPTVWIPSTLVLSPVELSERFAELKENRSEKALVGALQRLDPRVQEVYLGFNKFGFNDVRPLIHVHLADLPKASPLRMLGGGAGRLTDMLVSLPLASVGIFLVDEIDSGIYHDNLNALWEAIDAASQDSGVQVFATTHSWECVTAAIDAFESVPDDFRLHRLERRGDDVVVVTAKAEQVAGAVEYGFDVR